MSKIVFILICLTAFSPSDDEIRGTVKKTKLFQKWEAVTAYLGENECEEGWLYNVYGAELARIEQRKNHKMEYVRVEDGYSFTLRPITAKEHKP